MAITAYPKLALYIDGEWQAGVSTIPVHDPATGQIIGDCPVVSLEQLVHAVDAAETAMYIWQDYGPQKRSDIMRRAAVLFRERKTEIAEVMAYEQGKPLAEGLAEVDRAAEIIEWDAEEGRRLYGRVIESVPGIRRIVVREPLGVIAGFSPWNAPVGSPARKIAGPLAAGCGVVVKAAEESPACAILLLQAFIDAGIPKGLVNLVFGAPEATSTALIQNPKVRGITFTGSVPVGKALLAMCGAQMKPAVMELGGHAPVIVAEDADLDLAVSGLLATKTKNAGQICTSPSRVFVHRSRFDTFLSALKRQGATYKMGSGLDPATRVGPVATERRRDALKAMAEDAVAKGAERHDLAKPDSDLGYFLPLTVLANVPPQADIMSHEPFGPLMVVNPFDSLDEAIEAANSLPYGLAAYAFSESDRTLERLIDGLACGNLGLNTFLASTADSPLGGVKDSGYGREGGAESVINYTYAKNVVKSY